eukprot:9162246-Karenia_brevis.AAC.1
MCLLYPVVYESGSVNQQSNLTTWHERESVTMISFLSLTIGTASRLPPSPNFSQFMHAGLWGSAGLALSHSQALSGSVGTQA